MTPTSGGTANALSSEFKIPPQFPTYDSGVSCLTRQLENTKSFYLTKHLFLYINKNK